MVRRPQVNGSLATGGLPAGALMKVGRLRFDVSGLLRRQGTNLLAVRAYNSERKAGSPTADVIPLSGDFFMFDGIYRDVSLIGTKDSHIDLLDRGGSGVCAMTRQVTPEQATIAVRTRWSHDER